MINVHEQLERIRTVRPRSALHDFLKRTVAYEEAGARMPRPLVVWALVGALATLVLGLLGVALTPGASDGIAEGLHVLSWMAVALGVLLVITGACLSEARSAQSRYWMERQLTAGAVVPAVVLVLAAVYLLMAAVVAWCLVAVLRLALDI